jgi:hypothetical protein
VNRDDLEALIEHLRQVRLPSHPKKRFGQEMNSFYVDGATFSSFETVTLSLP